MAVTKNGTVVAIQGETDYEAALRYSDAQHQHLPEEQRPEPACEVLVVVDDDAGTRAQVAIRDWDQVAGLKQGAKVTLTLAVEGA